MSFQLAGSSVLAASLVLACAATRPDSDDGSDGGGAGLSTGGSTDCTPGSTSECYSGPEATKNVGICTAGVATCNADGSGFGECVGEVLPAREQCATPEDDDCNGASEPCTPGAPAWVRRFGEGDGVASGRKVAIAANGDVIVLGRTNGTIDFGGGPLAPGGSSDIVLVRLDAHGGYVWSKRFASLQGDQGSGLAILPSGDIIMTAAVSGYGPYIDFGGGPIPAPNAVDGFVVRLDAQGNHVWSKRYTAGPTQTGSSPDAVAVDASGDVIVAGWFSGSIDFGAGAVSSSGTNDVFVAKLDAQGNQMWLRTFGTPSGNERAHAVTLDANGNVLIGGYYGGGAPDFGGGPLPATIDGGFVAKLTANGAHVWSKGFEGGTVGEFVVRDLEVRTDGTVLVSGALGGTVNLGAGLVTASDYFDAAILGLSSNGSYFALQTFPGQDQQDPLSLSIDAADNMALCGDMRGDINLGGGFVEAPGDSVASFYGKLTNSGAHVYSRAPSVSGVSSCWSSAFDADGSLIVTGPFSGDIDFGSGPISAQGEGDIFIAKLHP